MPYFKVIGLNRDTGEQVQEVIEAKNGDDAVARVDFLVETVKRTKPKPVKPSVSNTSKTQKPVFSSLDSIGFCLNVAGGFAVLIALEFGATGFLDQSGLDNPNNSDIFVSTLFLLLLGLASIALGEVCKAVRVITVNSYKL